jgi:5'-deoxynucleotidase
MFHDSNETITGDMPTPIKYFNPDINKAYAGIEDIAKNKLLTMLPKELSFIYSSIFFKTDKNSELWFFVKSADRISAYIKCLEEEKVGNKEFKKAGASILKSIKKSSTPEVDYFMEKFLPGYKLSLDELD